MPSGPFYGFNRPGAKASRGIIQNWWRQGLMGSAGRGISKKRNKAEKNEKNLDKGVAKMFKDFPPGSGKR